MKAMSADSNSRSYADRRGEAGGGWHPSLLVGLWAYLMKISRTWFPAGVFRSSWGRRRGNGGNGGNGGGDKRDPFEVLGLARGKKDATIEEATKARRKLALKWHPDRNISNPEEATRKMQEINEAFREVQLILSSDNGHGESDDDDGCCESESDGSESESDAGKRSRRRKHENDGEEADEFERGFQRFQEEMNRFKQAQRAAQTGSFKPTSTNCADSRQKGVAGKGKSKAAKRRAAKKRRSKANKSCGDANKNDFDTGAGLASPAYSGFPFHRLPPEKRCEIRFKSPSLTRDPIFSAIRARTWSVLGMLTAMHNIHVCDPILLDENAAVTPLMIACYLGDDEAAHVIVQMSEGRWDEAVLATSRDGGDCLALAMESREIAKKLHEESMDHLDETSSEEDRARQEKLVERHGEGLEMAKKLVERILSLKQFALEKKRKEKRKRNVRFSVKLLTIGSGGLVLYFFGANIMFILGLVWAGVRFCLKWIMFIMVGLYTFHLVCLETDETERTEGLKMMFFILFVICCYYAYYWEPSQTTTADPTPKTRTDSPMKQGIDIFCADGETCFTEGDACTDGITEECCGMKFDSFVCECGADLRYTCHSTDACSRLTCESDGLHDDVETPLDIPGSLDTQNLNDTTTNPCSIDAACLSEGDTCTDGIVEECCGKKFNSFVCECGPDLKYSCLFTEACFNTTCEKPESTPGDSLMETVGVCTTLLLIVGCLVYQLFVDTGPNKKKRRKGKGKRK